MHILIVSKGSIPVTLYGGTERVIWSLGKELNNLGHKITFLVKKGSHCNFGNVIHINDEVDILSQIPNNIDVVHFNFPPKNIETLKKPYVITKHGNANDTPELDANTIFVSQNHAKRFNSTSFVYNGLDWSEYSKPTLKAPKDYFHFLGKAAWRVKNVTGAINTIKKTKNEKIKILGGVRFNVNMGIRFTFSPRASFYGMIGGQQKFDILNESKGLVFPVKWHEPFGLAITESLYYGCPVFGTPYGSLPEIVTKEVGFLSNNASDLASSIENYSNFSRKKCHEYAQDVFNAKVMALAYLEKYELVLNNKKLNLTPPHKNAVIEPKFLDWQE
ncbi:glycosyltransferase [Polaribacter sp. Q13]|uniref:glycosyltransferase n=1 Tax=Polaribacter sp. Q13 TaxID=2806551 RepID=UPI00193AEF04|nr:glycosyltransferase [Polaribacter sp. Q13]QVY65503.1 glycosyltransferase [Polaribacter sp. Q13]